MYEEMRPNSFVQASSDRSFGITFAAVFLLMGLAPWIFHDAPIRIWALGIAAGFVIAAFSAPRLLSPLNKIWVRFGLLLHRVVSPFVMGLIFFCAVVPTGLMLRLVGKDLLRLKRDPNIASYWILRTCSPSDFMLRQF